MITLITGGARSGKSRYAQEKALQHHPAPVYLATARYSEDDKEFSGRVHRHRLERDERWVTIEEPLYPSRKDLGGKTVVLDCITLWLSNIFSLCKGDVDASLDHLKNEMEALQRIDARFYIISNEIGMGLHAHTEIGRKFTDLQGWANQHVAAKACEVVFMVSGIPMTIKSLNIASTNC